MGLAVCASPAPSRDRSSLLPNHHTTAHVAPLTWHAGRTRPPRNDVRLGAGVLRAGIERGSSSFDGPCDRVLATLAAALPDKGEPPLPGRRSGRLHRCERHSVVAGQAGGAARAARPAKGRASGAQGRGGRGLVRGRAHRSSCQGRRDEGGRRRTRLLASQLYAPFCRTITPPLTSRSHRSPHVRRANIEAAEASVAATEVERQETAVIDSATPSRACDACPSPERKPRSDLWQAGVATRPPPPPTGPPAPASTSATAIETSSVAVQAEVGPMPPQPPHPPKFLDGPYSAAEPGSGEPRVVIPPFQPPVPPTSGRGFYPEGAFCRPAGPNFPPPCTCACTCSRSPRLATAHHCSKLLTTIRVPTHSPTHPPVHPPPQGPRWSILTSAARGMRRWSRMWVSMRSVDRTTPFGSRADPAVKRGEAAAMVA